MGMGAISRKRNINVEVLRICSAWLVILTHMLNKNYTDSTGGIRDKVCLLNTICIVAVPCFFMVAGYFATKGQSIARKLRHVGISVVIPSLIVIFLYQALWAWITGQASLTQSISQADYGAIWTHSITWSINKLPGCSTLWYITTYVQLMLMFPVFSLLCAEGKEARNARITVYALCLSAYFIKDLQQLISFGGTMFKPFDRSVFYFLLGYELSRVDWKKIPVWVPAAGLAAGCAMMYGLTRGIYGISGSFSDYFFHYETVPCAVASVSAFGLAMKLRCPSPDSKTGKMIIQLADATFYVYLIHNGILYWLMCHTPLGEDSRLRVLALLWLATGAVSFVLAGIVRKLQKTIFSPRRA